MEKGETKVKLGYEILWKFIIRPPRDKYPLNYLGPQQFKYNSKIYIRRDFELISHQGFKMKSSLIEPLPTYRPSKKMPVVIYLHGNASSRLEGLNTLNILLPHNINLFIVDLPGCGYSEGEYISLGYYESYDVGIIVDFLENLPSVSNIGIWGRSMGASTGLIYAHRDKRIKALCLDSPFANFCRLARELTKQYISLPDFLINGVLKIIGNTIEDKIGIDIFKLNPIEEAENTFQPALFIHAINDKLINVQHAMDIFNIYGGEKSLKCSEVGGHNSKRPKRLTQEIGNFFEKYLGNDINEFDMCDDKIYSNINLIKNIDINQSFVFKTGEDNKDRDRYNFEKEENDQKNMDEIKNILLNMKENDISKESTELNSFSLK
jgi:cephalosporin-C deacetylase-like acetyl esterase